MTKEQLFELLKESLTIELQTYEQWEGKGFKAVVKFDNKEVCSDYFVIEHSDWE